MAIMALLVKDPHLDINKCIRMALVHDMAEAITGDITPHDGISAEEKRNLETVHDVIVIFNVYIPV